MANTAVIMVDPSRAAVAVMISLLNFNLSAIKELYMVSKVVNLQVGLGCNSPAQSTLTLGHNGLAGQLHFFNLESYKPVCLHYFQSLF